MITYNWLIDNGYDDLDVQYNYFLNFGCFYVDYEYSFNGKLQDLKKHLDDYFDFDDVNDYITDLSVFDTYNRKLIFSIDDFMDNVLNCDNYLIVINFIDNDVF